LWLSDQIFKTKMETEKGEGTTVWGMFKRALVTFIGNLKTLVESRMGGFIGGILSGVLASAIYGLYIQPAAGLPVGADFDLVFSGSDMVEISKGRTRKAVLIRTDRAKNAAVTCSAVVDPPNAILQASFDPACTELTVIFADAEECPTVVSKIMADDGSILAAFNEQFCVAP
jgi:hypothetical protein